jgi:PAS domain S-box-containing protein
MTGDHNTPNSGIPEPRDPADFIRIGAALAIIAGLYLISLYNYLLFHSLVELFGIAIALAIFVIIWNLRRLIPDTLLLIVGISFFFIGCLDLIHTLAYKGMGVFPGNSADLPTQLWIAARYFQSIAFLIATCYIGRTITRDRRFDVWIIFASGAAASILLLASIFVWKNFPACFVEGIGLTPFKIGSEYLISLILLATIAVMFLNRRHIDPPVFRSLVAAQVFLILGELAFTSYASVYGFMNLLGHLFRLVSVYFFYRAFVDISLTRAYETILMELKAKESRLKESDRKYRNLYQYAQAGLFETSLKNATVVSCNERFCELFGFPSVREAIGNDMSGLYADPYARPEVIRILNGQGSIENRLGQFRNRATGKLFWGVFSVRYDPERDLAEGSIIDVTLQKEAEEALRDSNRQLQEAQALAHLGFWNWDVTTGQVEWSREVFRIFGLDPDEFTPQIDSILARSPWPEEQQRGQELVRRARESREPGSYEQRFLRPDQSTGYYYSTFQGRYDDAGTLVSISGTVLDITELRMVEDALRQSESRFRTLVMQLPVGIAMTRRSEKGEDAFYLNQQFTSITGYTLDTTPTFDAWAIRAYPDPEYRLTITGIAAEMYAEAAREITSRPGVSHVTCLDGSTKEIESRYTDLGVFGFWTVIDITERLQAEVRIRDANEELSRAQSIAHVGSWQYDLVKNVIVWSDETYRIFGYEPGSFVPDLKKIREMTHHDDLKKYDEYLVRAAATNFYQPAEYRIVRPDGTLRYVYRNAAVIPDQDGNAIRIIGVIQDITERKQADAALAESERKFREVFTTSRDCIFITTPEGRWIDFNDAALDMFGYGSREELMGMSILALYERPEIRDVFTALIAKEGFVKEYPVRLIRMDGTVIDTLITAVPLYNADGTVNAFSGSIRDITERRRAEDQRETLIRELEQKNAELERFTYTVSHDLKSPLITIKGFAGMLENDAKSIDPFLLSKDIQRIKTAADTMENLLSDLLELARVGRIINPPSAIPFGTIAKEAADLLAGPLAERGVEVRIEPDLPNVYVDHARIREAMVNLIENAIKFMGDRPDPAIRIGVETGGAVPVFFVQDNGIGIDRRYLERIFNLFEKLDPPVPGTGIGLPIIRRIIEVHGGKIWAESDGPGKGTTFRFTLPGAGPVFTDNNNNG